MTARGAKAPVVEALRDFVAFCDLAADQIVARGKDAWDADITLRLAGEAVLHKLGESVARLPDDFIAANPQVSWREIKGTRNIIAHRYHQVDYDIIWSALSVSLPGEAERVRGILRSFDA